MVEWLQFQFNNACCMSSVSLQAHLKAEFGPSWFIFIMLPVGVTESKEVTDEFVVVPGIFSENCWDF